MVENEVVEGSEPSTGAEEQSLGSEGAEQTKDVAEQLVDLDSVQKFRWAGRELTPKDLQSMVLMQSDYTKKTQAISEERKYYDNLEYDLENIKRNPHLADQFKQIYPEKFHKYLGYVVPANSQQGQGVQGNVGAQPDMSKLESRLNQIESEYHAQKVAATGAEIDAKFKVLSEKYPMADEEAVIARAQALLERKLPLTDEVWDKLWKSVHSKNEVLAKKHYSQEVNKQKQANVKGRGVGAGGGIPGQAPKVPRTIKEASNHLLAELENS